MINDTELEILTYIYDRPGVIPENIMRKIFKGDASKRNFMYRRLAVLRDLKLVKIKPVSSLNAGISPKQYFVSLKGTKVLKRPPVRFPADSDKSVVSRYRDMAYIRTYFRDQCQKQHWYMFEENNECRLAIKNALRTDALKRFSEAQPDYFYDSQTPQKIEPDFVIYTGEETKIIITCNPIAKTEAFKKLIEKYIKIIYQIHFVVYTLKADQDVYFQEALHYFNDKFSTPYFDRFTIYPPEVIGYM